MYEGQREDIEANLPVENRVGDTKGLAVEEPKDNLPIALGYQAKY